MKNILIWGTNWIGDVICSLPSINAIRDRFPESKITVVVPKPSDEILYNHSSIDSIVTLKRDIADRYKMINTLRMERFDAAVIFPNSFRAAFMVYLTGAKRRIGYSTDHRAIFLTDKIPPPSDNNIHLTRYFFNIVTRLGCSEYKADTRLNITRDEIEAAHKYVAGIKGEGSGVRLIAVHPCASKPPRGWNIEKFARLCNILAERYNAVFVVIGSESEYEAASRIKDFVKDRVLFACGNLSIRDVMAVIKISDLFIGNDSGMMHIASALSTPTVAIFGPDLPERRGAAFNLDKFIPVSKRFPCSPCRQRFFKDCAPSVNGKAPCIEAVEVEDVLEGIEGLLTVGATPCGRPD